MSTMQTRTAAKPTSSKVVLVRRRDWAMALTFSPSQIGPIKLLRLSPQTASTIASANAASQVIPYGEPSTSNERIGPNNVPSTIPSSTTSDPLMAISGPVYLGNNL